MRWILSLAIVYCGSTLLTTLSQSKGLLSTVSGHAAEVYRLGGIEVRLYDTREELWKDLPAYVRATYEPVFKALGGNRVLSGWGDSANKRAYAIKNFCVLLHELKHIMEPDWSHNLEDTNPCAGVRE